MYDFIDHYHRIANNWRQQALSERLAFMVPFFRIKHPGKPDSGCHPLKNDQKTSNRAFGARRLIYRGWRIMGWLPPPPAIAILNTAAI
jgi:hypothetical protein